MRAWSRAMSLSAVLEELVAEGCEYARTCSSQLVYDIWRA